MFTIFTTGSHEELQSSLNLKLLRVSDDESKVEYMSSFGLNPANKSPEVSIHPKEPNPLLALSLTRQCFKAIMAKLIEPDSTASDSLQKKKQCGAADDLEHPHEGALGFITTIVEVLISVIDEQFPSLKIASPGTSDGTCPSKSPAEAMESPIDYTVPTSGGNEFATAIDSPTKHDQMTPINYSKLSTTGIDNATAMDENGMSTPKLTYINDCVHDPKINDSHETCQIKYYYKIMHAACSTTEVTTPPKDVSITIEV